VAELVSLAEERDITVFRLDGHHISDKATFLREAAVSMHFPAYFGDNWDSFEECIRDLVWQPANSYVLLYDRFRSFAENNPPHWETATEILSSAVDYWNSKHIGDNVSIKMLEVGCQMPAEIGLFTPVAIRLVRASE
jgi:Barstar (barnase inhibitor)